MAVRIVNFTKLKIGLTSSLLLECTVKVSESCILDSYRLNTVDRNCASVETLIEPYQFSDRCIVTYIKLILQLVANI